MHIYVLKQIDTSGGSKRGARDAHPLRGPNSLIFTQFQAQKIGQHTHFGSWRPQENPGCPNGYRHLLMQWPTHQGSNYPHTATYILNFWSHKDSHTLIFLAYKIIYDL